MELKHRLTTRNALPLWLVGLCLVLVACAQAVDSGEPASEASQEKSSAGETFADYDIVTLLPRDAIQAIDNPQFVSAAEADEQYSDQELILGVEFNGDARAYSVPLLSSHEIVNDTVGGVKIAVTW
ncbi:MAG: DUF3179 domain-containing protein [Chloroflexota bacterium]|nr:MAG: DUF3179 domain-containing protein [Chloroflexota bacterium]